MSEIKEKIVEEIVESIQHIRYGEVVITIHDAKVVQIETREKKRFTSGKPLHAQS